MSWLDTVSRSIVLFWKVRRRVAVEASEREKRKEEGAEAHVLLAKPEVSRNRISPEDGSRGSMLMCRYSDSSSSGSELVKRKKKRETESRRSQLGLSVVSARPPLAAGARSPPPPPPLVERPRPPRESSATQPEKSIARARGCERGVYIETTLERVDNERRTQSSFSTREKEGGREARRPLLAPTSARSSPTDPTAMHQRQQRTESAACK